MRIKTRKTVYDGFFKVENVTLEHNGKSIDRDLVTPKNGVAALVYDTVQQQFVLTEQYRLVAGKPLVEIVAGLLDKEGEKPEDTIAREIEEEVGYAVDKLQLISTYYSTPGSFAEKIWLYYAEVSHKISAGGGVASENEDLKTVCFSREKLYTTPFEDAKTLIAVLWEQCKHRS
ncbi:NUDIX hydrolase [Adhaeribacter sp. BT258]|uniref:ADP-ribose pyrophosphatase n=1 Tax=Adhaeribacter terrigena TaxID=2793070 RepID=A0ABS1C5X5_9BACT|nr:NUDIX hydrolase [Adhaeribacter terrigena]MBK0404785.1 NUDIX hydrolase [Adhaeribacter terrigena]